MRIGIVGSGISGIAAAAVLQSAGHEVVVLERTARLGGVWAQAYPQVRLQNFWNQYHLSSFPWPSRPDDNPTAAQILGYLEAAVEHHGLDVRCESEVTELEELPAGWRARVRAPDGERHESFDFVVLAVGQYTQPKEPVEIPGQQSFRGELLTERDIDQLDRLAGRRVMVMGFGKTAVDLASFAAARGAKVDHVFRTPRWLIPMRIAGLVPYTVPLFTRMGTVMIPAWDHPTAAERFLHQRLGPLVRGFWAMIGGVVRMQARSAGLGHGRQARERLRTVEPEHSLLADMRSASALAPPGYYAAVARGEIIPHRGVVQEFSPDGVVLADGTALPCDVALLCLGSGSPRFPFMPEVHRERLECEPDGVQLYRHLIHPKIPRLAFAGYGHGFMHVPATEVGMVWVAAMLAGDLQLPPAEQMEACIEKVRAWKREHINFEPSRSCAVNTRYHQYIDILLADLDLSPHRKAGRVAEWLSRYEAADYAGVLAEYQAARAAGRAPSRVTMAST